MTTSLSAGQSPLTAKQLRFLQATDSPTIANAVEQFTVRDRCEGFIGGSVRALFPDLGVMVGAALTVTMTSRPGPVAGREGYWRLWEALEQAPRPSVVVVQDLSGEPTRCAYFGEVMATIASRLGAVGVVTNGGVRDLAEVRALGLHYFAPYAVVSHANFEILEVGRDVVLDGQVVRTGDLLHGDVNGIVIVPAEVLAQLPEAVERVRARERRLMEYARSPEFTLTGARRISGY